MEKTNRQPGGSRGVGVACVSDMSSGKPLCEIFNKAQLGREILTLKGRIQKMHIIAWQHRVNKDMFSMKAAHRHIGIAKLRISDCEWMIAELDKEYRRNNVYRLWEIVVVGIVAVAMTWR